MLINDLVETNDRALAACHPAGTHPRITHSPTITVEAQQLLDFLRERFYRAESVLTVMRAGADRIRTRFAQLIADPDLMAAAQRQRIDQDGLQRAVCDYVAGMTDRYLLGR